MASGYSTSGHFPKVGFTGTLSSIARHTSKGCVITSSSVSISGTTIPWSNARDILANYVVVTRYVHSGHQHCLISNFSPNRYDGNYFSVWNQSDNTQSPTYSIAGILIPKDLCTELT